MGFEQTRRRLPVVASLPASRTRWVEPLAPGERPTPKLVLLGLEASHASEAGLTITARTQMDAASKHDLVELGAVPPGHEDLGACTLP